MLSALFTEFFLNLKVLIPLLLGMIIFFMGLTVNIDQFKDVLKKPKWIENADNFNKNNLLWMARVKQKTQEISIHYF